MDFDKFAGNPNFNNMFNSIKPIEDTAEVKEAISVMNSTKEGKQLKKDFVDTANQYMINMYLMTPQGKKEKALMNEKFLELHKKHKVEEDSKMEKENSELKKEIERLKKNGKK